MNYHSFKKKEILRRKKLIQELFTKGKTLRLSLLRCYYLPCENSTHQVLFSIPKKIIKKAVDRNTLKRKIKEAYRVSKHAISHLDVSSPRFCLAYVYVGSKRQKPTYANLLKDIQKSMLRLQVLLHQDKLLRIILVKCPY